MNLRNVSQGSTKAPLSALVTRELQRDQYDLVDRRGLNDSIAATPEETVTLLKEEAESLRFQSSLRGYASTAAKLPCYAGSVAVAGAGVFAGVLSFSVLSSIGMSYGTALTTAAGMIGGGALGFCLARGGLMLAGRLLGATAQGDFFYHRVYGQNASAVSSLARKVEGGLGRAEAPPAQPPSLPPTPALATGSPSLWAATLDGVGSVAGEGERVLVATESSLKALQRSDGAALWNLDFDSPVNRTVVTAAERAYLTRGGQVLEVDTAEGKVRRELGYVWTNSKKSPQVALDGDTIYVTNQEWRGCAYGPEGDKPQWSVLGQLREAQAPTPGAEGTVFIADDDKLTLYQGNEPLWSSEQGASITHPPVADADNRSFVATQGAIKGVEPRFGLELWSRPAQEQEFGPRLDARGQLILSEKEKLVAVNPEDGQTLWERPYGGQLACAPVADSFGNLILAHQDGKLEVVNGEDGELLGERQGPESPRAVSLVEGELMVAHQNGVSAEPIYASLPTRE